MQKCLNSLKHIHKETLVSLRVTVSLPCIGSVAPEWERPLLNYASILSSAATVNYEPGVSPLSRTDSHVKSLKRDGDKVCGGLYKWVFLTKQFHNNDKLQLPSSVSSCSLYNMRPSSWESRFAHFKMMSPILAISVSLCMFLANRLCLHFWEVHCTIHEKLLYTSKFSLYFVGYSTQAYQQKNKQKAVFYLLNLVHTPADGALVGRQVCLCPGHNELPETLKVIQGNILHHT